MATMWWFEESVSVALGLACWALAYTLPMRRFGSRPEFIWDGIGAVCSSLFATGAAMISFYLYDQATDVDWVWDWTQIMERMPAWQLLLLNIVFVDFTVYWAHRALHSRMLWPTHAWHHSPRVLYWLSGLRGSPVHIAALYLPAGLIFIAFPTPETGLVSLASMLIDVGNQHFIHSNIRVPWTRELEWVFVTPRLHFVHHSSTPHRANSNYGFVFSFWDRLFGTYTDPDTVPADDPLGLGYEIGKGRLLLGLPARNRRPIDQASTSRPRNGESPAARVS